MKCTIKCKKSLLLPGEQNNQTVTLCNFILARPDNIAVVFRYQCLFSPSMYLTNIGSYSSCHIGFQPNRQSVAVYDIQSATSTVLHAFPFEIVSINSCFGSLVWLLRVPISLNLGSLIISLQVPISFWLSRKLSLNVNKANPLQTWSFLPAMRL